MTELRELFLSEALRHQAVLADDRSDFAAKLDAARGIQQAATFAGETRSAEVADKLARLYADPASGDESTIRELMEELARALVEGGLHTSDDATRIERRPAALEDIQTIDTSPPDTDLGLTDDELSALQSVFRDEASSHLEGAARVLGDSSTSAQDRLDALMRAAHSIKGSAATVGLDALAGAAHQFEDCLESPELAQGLDTRLDALLQCIDALREVAFAGAGNLGAALARFDDVLAEIGGEQPAARRPARRKRTTTSVPSDAGPPVLRIDAAHVDTLLEDLGALVLDQGRLERRTMLLGRLARELSGLRLELTNALSGAHGELERQLATSTAELQTAVASLAGDAEAMARAGDRLRRGLTELRMQSADSLFERLAPQIRSAAREAGKRVHVRFDGGDARFDKAVAETIADPLIHLVRNAVAHGIEDPEAREILGKPRDGLIRLSARQRADTFVLDVSDDGAGIDPQELRERLVDSEQWSASKARLASDEEVLAAIFDAGTTSRDQADELAGRGIGLDAVRATVVRLGGEVEVSSTPGLGTTFRLRLPLTTAVTNATTLIVGHQRLAIPSGQ
ncbi:MAG: Hpt domain-containing protein, partial [Deltaproteobacteria bacterium]|nr:Hpt domain-containing protein [Deltaproteobacteria bacterium]